MIISRAVTSAEANYVLKNLKTSPTLAGVSPSIPDTGAISVNGAGSQDGKRSFGSGTGPGGYPNDPRRLEGRELGVPGQLPSHALVDAGA